MSFLGRTLTRLGAVFSGKTDAEISAQPQPRDIRACAQSNAGKIRDVNEDAVCFLRPSNSASLLSRGALALVADGMGGAKGGKVASGIAHKVIPRSYLASKSSPPVALR
jgi:serine/threonine protein phosphatase PrpC